MAEERIPPLRAIEVVSFARGARQLYLLRDPQGIAAEPLVLSPASVGLLRFCDGRHAPRDVQLALTRATGRIVPLEQIHAFVAKLDAHHFLDSPDFQRRRAEMAREYAASPDRPARFAGVAYPAEPGAAQDALTAYYRAPDGPGLPAAAVAEMPAGILAPHIDPARGAAAYARAYRVLWGARPRRVVILGISHAGGPQPFILTTKDYATPWGPARTDRELIARVAARLTWDPLAGEDLHRAEHSIEFQSLFLRHALTRGGAAEVAPLHLPVLCAFPWQAFRADEAGAAQRRSIDEFLEALRAVLDEDPGDLLLVAGVDLAHRGRRFGDPAPLSAADRSQLEARDRETLALVTAGDHEAFAAEIVAEGDARRLCGFPAIYAFLRLLAGARGELCDYRQSWDPSTGSVVSFAAAVFPRR